MEGYENQGVFTYALLEGLEKAEGNENGDILIDLRNTVPRITNDRWHLWFRQLDLAPFDLLIWPHPAGESSSSMEPPSGLVGTVESVLCFPSRCGNPRCERISISGVSFHRPPFSFFFAPFFFLCACPQFSTEKYRARIA